MKGNLIQATLKIIIQETNSQKPLRAVLSVRRGWHSHVHFQDTGYTDILHKVHQRLIVQVSIVQGPSLVAQMVKNLPEVQETQVQSLYWEDPLEKGMATHSWYLSW